MVGKVKPRTVQNYIREYERCKSYIGHKHIKMMKYYTHLEENFVNKEFDKSPPNVRIMLEDVSIAEALNYKEKISKIDGVKEINWIDDSVNIQQPLDMIDTDTLNSWYKDNNALFTALVDKGDTLKQTIEDIKEIVGDKGIVAGDAVTENYAKTEEFVAGFEKAMDDDFNTADAVSAIYELVRFSNTEIKAGASKEFAEKIQDMLDHLCGVLGVAEVAEEEVSDEDVAKIEALIAERTEAKKVKDFAKADAIRDELAAMGITIKDTRQGVQWFRG